jgi:hypothetical protein
LGGVDGLCAIAAPAGGQDFSLVTNVRELDWCAQRTDIGETILSAWRWFVAHPNGYDE